MISEYIDVLPCQCKCSGYCVRHQRRKTRQEVQKCKKSNDYRIELDVETFERTIRNVGVSNGDNPSVVNADANNGAVGLACIHRGAQTREVICNLCGRAGETESVHSCALFGECTIRKYKSRQPEQSCLSCRHRSESTITANNFFNKVVVISLARRKDRLKRFRDGLPKNWPFKSPELFIGIDGNSVRCPQWFRAGRGAFGCYSSHLHILRELTGTTLILEDDAVFHPDFVIKAAQAIAQLPPDWEMCYFGGQHLKRKQQRPVKFSEHLVKPFNVNRTHAYAVTEPFAKWLYEYLQQPELFQVKGAGHIDHVYGRLTQTGQRKIFAINPWIVGQAEGQSNVNGRIHSKRFWNGAL